MKKYSFICLSLLVALTFSACQSISNVPTDATEFQGHYYKVFESKVTWHQAEEQCRQMGGMLASVKSAEANDFIVKLSQAKGMWIGGSDEVKEGEWLWRDGSKLTYSKWASSEPDNWYDGKEHWTVIGWPGKRYADGKWGDTQAFSQEPIDGFVCEWTD